MKTIIQKRRHEYVNSGTDPARILIYGSFWGGSHSASGFPPNSRGKSIMPCLIRKISIVSPCQV